MKPNIINSFLFLFITFSYSQSSPSIEWEKCYGGNGVNSPYSVKQTIDGGFIIVGETSSTNGFITNNYGGYDCWVIKTNNIGTVEWQKTLGGSNYDQAKCVQQTTDGGYIFIGMTSSNNFDVTGHYGNFDVWVVKLNNLGVIEWQKAFGGSSSDFGQSIQQTSDGGYIFCGKTNSTNGAVTTAQGGWVVKLNNLGVIVWQKNIGGFSSSMESIQNTSDGGYIVSGYSSGPLGSDDYLIAKLDSLGNIQWQKYFGGTADDRASSVQQTSDGGYIVVGSTNSSNTNVTANNGSWDYWVIKLNNLGDLQWEKALGGSSHDFAESLQQTSDGGYVVCGYTSSTNGMITGNHGDVDFWIVKLNSLGFVSWQKTLGGTITDWGRSIQQTTDGGFIVTGNARSNNNNVTNNPYGDSFWLVKLSPETLSNNDFNDKLKVTFYPNPIKDFLNFKTEHNITKVEVYDIAGRIVSSNSVSENKIDLSELKTGNYILKLYTEKGIINTKIIKE